MFDKGKQLIEMRKQAKKLQGELSQVTETVEHKGYKIKVSADNKVVYMEKDGEELKDLTDGINKAFKNVQKKAAKTMMEMGGGLSGLLGN